MSTFQNEDSLFGEIFMSLYNLLEMRMCDVAMEISGELSTLQQSYKQGYVLENLQDNLVRRSRALSQK